MCAARKRASRLGASTVAAGHVECKCRAQEHSHEALDDAAGPHALAPYHQEQQAAGHPLTGTAYLEATAGHGEPELSSRDPQAPAPAGAPELTAGR